LEILKLLKTTTPSHECRTLFDRKEIKPYGQRLETLLKAAKDQNSDVEEFQTKMKVIRDAYLEAKGAKELTPEETYQEYATMSLFMKDYHSSAGLARLSESGEEEDEEEPPVDLFLNQLDLMVKRVGLFQQQFATK